MRKAACTKKCVAMCGRELGMLHGVCVPPAKTLFVDQTLAGMFHYLAAFGAQIDARILLERYRIR